MKKTILTAFAFLVSTFTFCQTNFEWQIKDSVKTLKEKEGRYQVLFETHAGIYYLNKTNTHFESLLKILKESQTSKKEIKLQVDSTSLEINIPIL